MNSNWKGCRSVSSGVISPYPVPVPRGLRAELRAYQLEGVAWLQFLRSYELGNAIISGPHLISLSKAYGREVDDFELGGIALGTILVIVFFHMVKGRGGHGAGTEGHPAVRDRRPVLDHEHASSCEVGTGPQRDG